jgi:hypothetical protein
VSNGGAYQINDAGLLVPVGIGNDYTDGPLEDYFGSKITIDGVQYDWGLPFEGWASVPNPATGQDDTVKFRELSLRYTFNRNQLEPLLGNFIKRISLSVIGRNLATFTDYRGYDPEVATSNSDGVVFRVDAFEYPNYRTFTGAIEIEF